MIIVYIKEFLSFLFHGTGCSFSVFTPNSPLKETDVLIYGEQEEHEWQPLICFSSKTPGSVDCLFSVSIIL